METVARAENPFVFLVSSANGVSQFNVTNIGSLGINVDSPGQHIDISGELGLRSGNANTSTASIQVAFGGDGTLGERHALVSRHNSSVFGNSLDFYVWNNLATSTGSVAVTDLLAIQASTNPSGGVMHVRPAGDPSLGVELLVSNGSTLGGGSVIRAEVYSSSSEKVKTDVSKLGRRNEIQAYQDVMALKPARFAYKEEPAGALLRRGLIFEDTPESIRGPGYAVSLDARLANIEMAIKEAAQRASALAGRIEALEKP
jgi:hypothetical protein